MSVPGLGTPLTLRCGAVINNRLAKAAMTEGLADARDNPDQALRTLYETWAQGGAGILITGNVMIDRRYLERPGNVVIDDHSDLDALRAWARAGTAAGNHLWMQISHVGRQCNRASGHQPVSPSTVGLELLGMFQQPRAMTEAEIEVAIDGYAQVARIARQTGFTGVQIHGAHGYLISQFLSPRINQRTDQWGGSLANRARFLLRIVDAVREAVGSDYPVAVKLNSADFQKGGFSAEESEQVAAWLDEAGIDLLEISGGNYEQPQLLGHEGVPTSAEPPKRDSTVRREAYFLQYAERIRRTVKMPLMVTGGFRSRSGMLSALADGSADVIGLARPLCVDPDLPNQLLAGAVESAPSWEHQIVYKGRWTGPTSPLLPLRMINVQGEVAWFYRQIVRLGQGQPPDPALGLGRALRQHLLSEFKLGRRRRAPAADG